MDKAAKDQEAKARRFIEYSRLRCATELTADQIAERMAFGSAVALYKQLELDGSPVCGVCGQLYPEPGHREKHRSKRKKKLPGVGGGHRVELPDTVPARELVGKC